jgi:lysophospholipase L1-like esterase
LRHITIIPCFRVLSTFDLPPLQGTSLGGRFPGLKPWAESLSPLRGIAWLALNTYQDKPWASCPLGAFLLWIGARRKRYFLFVFLAILLQSCAENPQSERTLTDRNTSQLDRDPAFDGSRKGLPILMVGDSLTVGGFGEAVEEYLLRRFGSNNVAIFASCGSSPEHWVRSGPDYITKCGYREQTHRSSILYDFERGRRPRRVLTPKLEDLVAKFRPKTVIVQLGTNWMDGMHSDPARDQSTYGEILDRFVAAIHSEPDTVRRIIWITPPDSSRYSKALQTRVTNLIKTASRRHSFEIIDSSRLTHYVRGQSGSDGVHYNKAAARVWANRVTRELDSMLR